MPARPLYSTISTRPARRTDSPRLRPGRFGSDGSGGPIDLIMYSSSSRRSSPSRRSTSAAAFGSAASFGSSCCSESSQTPQSSESAKDVSAPPAASAADASGSSQTPQCSDIANDVSAPAASIGSSCCAPIASSSSSASSISASSALEPPSLFLRFGSRSSDASVDAFGGVGSAAAKPGTGRPCDARMAKSSPPVQLSIGVPCAFAASIAWRSDSTSRS